MNIRVVLSLVGVLLILPAAIAGVGWWRGVFSHAAAPATSADAERPPINGPIVGEKVSLDVAQGRVSWTIPLPSYTVGNATLAEVWVSFEQRPSAQRQVYVIYSNGLQVSIGPEPFPPSNWAALATPPFQQIPIKGFSGMGTDPGVQNIKGHGTNEYPGSVTWWENKLMLRIYGEFPMTELMKVAESMSAVVWSR